MYKAKIVICGGHLSPAMAVIEEVKKKNKYEPIYIGRKYALEGDRALSLEYSVITQEKIPFYSITTARLQRSITLYTIPSLLKLPLGFFQSLILLVKIRPKLVLSFGGYVSLPICFSAWMLRIPIIIHEQTHVMGLTNRIISRIAKKVCLSFADTKCVSFKNKVIITGNPIRQSVTTETQKKDLTNFGNNNLPILYITGGSLGARSINIVVSAILPYLVKKFRVIHQCGSADGDKDFKMLIKVKNSLPSAYKRNYFVIKHIDPNLIGSILQKTTLVVSRAGANTTAELVLVGVPSVLIPLPWSGDKEQEHNALFLEKMHVAKVIKQKELSREKLIETIDFMQKNISRFKNNAQKAKKMIRSDASKSIISVIDSLLENE